MILAMVPSQLVQIFWVEAPVTDVTLSIDYLGLGIEDASFQEHGMEHSQDVSVSHWLSKDKLLYRESSYLGMAGCFDIQGT